MITTNQKKYAYGLLRRLGLNDDKEEIIFNFTNGRTSHISSMTHEEFGKFIEALDPNVKDKKEMTGKVLSVAHELGWELANGKVNMDKIDQFCMKRTPAKKALDRQSKEELIVTVTIFKKLEKGLIEGF